MEYRSLGRSGLKVSHLHIRYMNPLPRNLGHQLATLDVCIELAALLVLVIRGPLLVRPRRLAGRW